MGVITAQTSTILERRLADREARTDRQLSPGFIEMEQFLELGIAFYQANELSIPINIFRNEKGTSIDKISGEILGYVNDVISNRSKSIGNYRS
ncbi:MAG: hypothetical protein M1284_00020 [Candidatus Parvarchaeota archaeon]|jgi:adenylate kinase|nr:hypothetical protein [Candidatus Parvarchaeota archaeon]